MNKVIQQSKKIKLHIKKVTLNVKLLVCLMMFPLLWGCGSGTGLTGLMDDTGEGGGNPSAGITLTAGKLGAAVGFADVDGDGITDKIIGAPSAAKSSDLGIALIYKGTATGFDSAYTTLTGDNSFGSSFVNLGDEDGDSTEDFAIGAIYGDGEDVSMSGAVHVFKGGSKGQTLIRKISGEGPMDRFGLSLTSGDLNGDGKSDLIIGAPFNTHDPALYQSGAVYVYFGPDFTTQVALRASLKNKGLGWQVASGDINNDGVADLLIAASGKVLGYYGGPSFAPVIDSPDLTMTSSATGFGKSIAVIGDVDNDGYGYREIVIGAPNAVISNNRDTGSIYVVKGGTGARTINVNSTPAPADLVVRIDGAALFDRFGTSIAAVDAGDGDSLPDIAVGAPNADVDTSLKMAGKVYLFKGKEISATTALSNATVFNGDEKYQGFGTVLTAAPEHHLLLGMPMCHKYSGHVEMVDLVSGQNVAGDSGGGTTSDDHQEHDH